MFTILNYFLLGSIVAFITTITCLTINYFFIEEDGEKITQKQMNIAIYSFVATLFFYPIFILIIIIGVLVLVFCLMMNLIVLYLKHLSKFFVKILNNTKRKLEND